MVLTTSHTISKSKTDEEKFDATTDNLRDSEYFTEYTVSKHDRFHHKPRRQELGRTTTRKAEEKKTSAMAKTAIAAKKNKSPFFSSEKFLNLFKKKKYKTSTKCTEKRKENDERTTEQRTVPAEIAELATKSRRNKRKLKKNFALEMQKRHAKSYKTLFSTKGKLAPKSSKDFTSHSGLDNDFHLPWGEVTLAYALPFTTDEPPTALLSAEPGRDFMGTAELERMLAQIKERAMFTIAHQPSPISEIITSTVTETTFDADPILRHYFPRNSTLKNLFSYYMKQKRSLNSTIAAMEAREDGNSLKSNVATTTCGFEAQLQKEIKELLHMIKCKLRCGLKCVKSTTKSLVHDAKAAIHKATEPKNNGKPAKKVKAHPLRGCSCKDTDLNMARNARNGTPKRYRLFRHRKTTTNVPVQQTLPVEDDYSMLKQFEHVLSKTHEDNVLKMVTTPKNLFSYKRNVNKVSKRNQETIEDFNLKENIRKLVDFDSIPDELDYDKDTSVGASRKEDYDPKIEALRINSSSTDSSSLEGLSKRLSYKEYVDGFKNYLNYVRDTTSSNFSNLVRYQAHRHHKVEDIGKFILDKIPNTVLQRNKRRFFDDSYGDDQDMSTKSDESWFKRHFYLFIDTGPPKKYHTVSSKRASETIQHKRGKKFPATAVNEFTTEETKDKIDGDINEILKFLDYTVHSLATLQVDGR